MKTTIIIALLSIAFPAFSELTSEDIDKIREVIKQENAVIHSEMVQLELRITQKIQESENRLRAELNAQLNARMNDFTIVFGITSGGFFLLFASVLLINALRGRTLTDKKTVLVFILSITAALLCFASTVKAQQDREFGHITCTGLTVIDERGWPRILLTYEDGRSSVSLNGGKDKITSIGGMEANEKQYSITFAETEKGHAMYLGANSEHNEFNLVKMKSPRRVIGLGFRGSTAYWGEAQNDGSTKRIPLRPKKDSLPNKKQSQPRKPSHKPNNVPPLLPPTSDWLLDK